MYPEKKLMDEASLRSHLYGKRKVAIHKFRISNRGNKIIKYELWDKEKRWICNLLEDWYPEGLTTQSLVATIQYDFEKVLRILRKVCEELRIELNENVTFHVEGEDR